MRKCLGVVVLLLCFSFTTAQFQPPPAAGPYETGWASWYGDPFHGQPTANGETYDMYAMTAAHPSLPFGSAVRVTNVATGRSVVVRINDRGPFLRDRIVDLSYAAAKQLRLVWPGSGEVRLDLIDGGTDLASRFPSWPPPEPLSARSAPEPSLVQAD
jgi:rare lipoprotein A